MRIAGKRESACEDLAVNEKVSHPTTGENRRDQVTSMIANACADGHLGAAKLLISKGFTDVADIRELDCFVLAMAFHHNQLEVVQFLVDRFDLVAADVFAAGWANYGLGREASPAMYTWMHDTYGPEEVD
jgi:hypothetical protein